MKTLAQVVLAGLCLASTGLHAQTSVAALEPGARARIIASNARVDPLVGRIVSRDSISLLIRTDRSRATVAVRWPDIERAEVSRGRRRGSWAAAGFGLGLVGGFAIGSVVALSDRNDSMGANLAPVGFSFFGMLGGAVVGALAAPERWSPVPVPPGP